jgi:pimeloyl-ACP methyl ester carboxylesterase
MALSFEISTKDGVLRAKRWPGGSRPILFLHGWLDNLATFEKMIPYFSEYDAVAFDFVGHGHSDHIARNSSYSVLHFLRNVYEAAMYLNWNRFDIIGHSFGATLGLMYAGLFPEKVRSTVCIDGIGNFPAAPSDIVQRLRRSVIQTPEERILSMSSIDEAVLLRQHSKIPTSELASRELISRGLKQVEEGYEWSNDTRLIEEFLYSPITPAHYFQEQLFESIKCKVLIVLGAESGVFTPQIIARNSSLIKESKVLYQPGQHHLHIDHAEDVARAILPFLEI